MNARKSALKVKIRTLNQFLFITVGLMVNLHDRKHRI